MLYSTKIDFVLKKNPETHPPQSSPKVYSGEIILHSNFEASFEVKFAFNILLNEKNVLPTTVVHFHTTKLLIYGNIF